MVACAQVLRRLCGLNSPSSAGSSKASRVVNGKRVADLAALNVFRDVAHTLMPKIDDVGYIREVIRLFGDVYQGEGMTIATLALDPRSLGAMQCCVRKYPGDEFLTASVAGLSAALSDVFIESSGKGLMKYVREALGALESGSTANVVKRIDSSGVVWYEVGTGRNKTKQSTPPDEYKAMVASLAPLERMGIALDPEGLSCPFHQNLVLL